MGSFASLPYHLYQARKKVPKKETILPENPQLPQRINKRGVTLRRYGVVKAWRTGITFGRWTGTFALFSCLLSALFGPVPTLIKGTIAGGFTGGILTSKRRPGMFTAVWK
jgi:hypothetical protein